MIFLWRHSVVRDAGRDARETVCAAAGMEESDGTLEAHMTIEDVDDEGIEEEDVDGDMVVEAKLEEDTVGKRQTGAGLADLTYAKPILSSTSGNV